MPGEGDDDGYQPDRDDHHVGGAVAIATVVANRSVDGMEPVNADTDKTIDGNGTEKHVSSNPGLAERDPQPPAARGDDVRDHHKHCMAQVSTGEGHHKPENICKVFFLNDS